jgi:drug/metabolite transporter (DMT)-like permease
MVKTCSASKLSAFAVITPLFGVAAGYVIMHDQLTPAFGVAALSAIFISLTGLSRWPLIRC